MNAKKCKLLRTLARQATVGDPERAYRVRGSKRNSKGDIISNTITLDTDYPDCNGRSGVRNTRDIYQRLKKAYKRLGDHG